MKFNWFSLTAILVIVVMLIDTLYYSIFSDTAATLSDVVGTLALGVVGIIAAVLSLHYKE